MTVKVKVAQSCLTVCDPMVYTVHGIRQARIQERVAFPFSRGASQPIDQTQVSHIKADSLPSQLQGKPKNTGVGSLSLLQQIFPTQESNLGGLLLFLHKFFFFLQNFSYCIFVAHQARGSKYSTSPTSPATSTKVSNNWYEMGPIICERKDLVSASIQLQSNPSHCHLRSKKVMRKDEKKVMISHKSNYREKLSNYTKRRSSCQSTDTWIKTANKHYCRNSSNHSHNEEFLKVCIRNKYRLRGNKVYKITQNSIPIMDRTPTVFKL